MLFTPPAEHCSLFLSLIHSRGNCHDKKEKEPRAPHSETPQKHITNARFRNHHLQDRGFSSPTFSLIFFGKKEGKKGWEKRLLDTSLPTSKGGGRSPTLIYRTERYRKKCVKDPSPPRPILFQRGKTKEKN